MIEVAFFGFLHLLSFPIGLVIGRELIKCREVSLAISGLLGYGIVSVLTQILFTWGFSITTLTVVLSFLSVGSFVYLGIYCSHSLRVDLKDGIIYLIAASLLISPALIGGGQFVIFQGNSFDHFNYLQAAVSYQDYDHAYLRESKIEQFLKDPFVEYGQNSLSGRPAVITLYAVATYLFRGSVVQLPYIYLCFFIAQGILAVTWVSRRVLNEDKYWIPIFVGAASGLGFWGQYLIDQNWWSQISATPLLILLVYGVFHRARMTDSLGLRHDIFLGMLLTSSVYLYPEGVAFLIPGIISTWLMTLRSSPPRFSHLAFVGIMCLAIIAINYSSTVGYSISQALSQIGKSSNQYLHGFHGYFIFGNDGISGDLLNKWFSFPIREQMIFGNSNSVISELVDIFAGISGLFFLTPGMNFEPWAKALIRLLLLGFLSGLLLVIGSALVRQISNYEVRLYTTFFLVESVMIVALVLSGAFYGSLKGYSYMIPVCFPMLCFAVQGTKLAKNVLLLFLAFQIGFGFIRPYAATNVTGVHYKFPPYPSANFASNKAVHKWDIDRYRDELIGCSGLKITNTFDNGFYERFVQLLAKQHELPYFLEGPVQENYGVSNVIRGYMPEIEYDCVVSQIELGTQRGLNIERL